MSNKTINIKVNRLIAIQELENKLVAAKAVEEAYEKEMAAYNEALVQFQLTIAKELTAGNFKFIESYNPIDVCSSTENTIRAYIKLTNLPAEPKEPKSPRSRDRVSVKDIERMIRLLKMSTDESVSTKVYDSLGEML
jgi:hypothetical protein